jgi:hypothetical protein
MGMCQDAVVAHSKISVRNSLGFRRRRRNVTITGIRSRLELRSSLMRVRKLLLWKTDQWERNDLWNQNVKAVKCRDSPPDSLRLSHWPVNTRILITNNVTRTRNRVQHRTVHENYSLKLARNRRAVGGLWRAARHVSCFHGWRWTHN